MKDPSMHTVSDSADCWPALPLEAWKDTRDTLHMWTQIVGKVKLALTPLTNHWWNVPLYVSPRGLTTSAISCAGKVFEVEFDFIHHQLCITVSDGQHAELALAPRSVADFYREFMATLRGLGIQAQIWAMPVEIPDPIAFDKDHVHASYDPAYANRFWRVLASADAVFKEFRSGFLGKSSPVHFFWGSFDLAHSRFSGRRAPERAGADSITREAYSHEVISAGFWPGGGEVPDAAFYCYAAPEPAGFSSQTVRPKEAFYQAKMGEFILMYESMRTAQSPVRALLEFAQSTYESGASLGKWDRASLERPTAETADVA